MLDSPYILEARNVYKKYHRDKPGKRLTGVSDMFLRVFNHKPPAALNNSEFWGVAGVSFSLKASESIGIIGSNGSGKSTLMKLLAGISKPDAGEIVVSGRVEALINLQAGFDPELSGFDNLINVAAIRGIPRGEIDAVVTKAVEFSEIGEAIDMQVKTYSSGMAARLGYGLCINMHPDILLIDEALSVGDAAFKKKCISSLRDKQKAGVAFVLVSHNTEHIKDFCKKTMWIEHGVVKAFDDTGIVLSQYE